MVSNYTNVIVQLLITVNQLIHINEDNPAYESPTQTTAKDRSKSSPTIFKHTQAQRHVYDTYFMNIYV